jgi:hypothetical protein
MDYTSEEYIAKQIQHSRRALMEECATLRQQAAAANTQARIFYNEKEMWRQRAMEAERRLEALSLQLAADAL